MIRDVYKKNIEDVYRTSIVQQTAFWSQVKQKLGSDSIAFDFKVNKDDAGISPEDKGCITGDMLVLVKKLDKHHSLAYVPYGPELEPEEQKQGLFLEELSEVMRSFLPQNCIMIRYDLSWESYWAKDPDYYTEEEKWMGPPDINAQEIRFNFNTINWNFRKAFSNVLPSNTIYLDLKKEKDELLKSMKQKTRYNIHLSQNRGVNVRIAGIKELDTWYKLYEETSARNKFRLHGIDYFRTMLSVDSNRTQSPAEVLLLIAETGGIPLSAMFLVIAGNRGTYLYGASSDHNRNLMGSYALQWEALNISKDMGCKEYDMFGVAPKADPAHPLYGLYRFKSGFGGEMFHTLGCWDYPLDQEKYSVFRAIELNEGGFHIN